LVQLSYSRKTASTLPIARLSIETTRLKEVCMYISLGYVAAFIVGGAIGYWFRTLEEAMEDRG
jgi:hypothetical protein